MSSDIAIRSLDLGKRYRVGATQSHITLAEAVLSRVLGRRQRIAPTDLWVLRGLDLEVKRGEVLGPIGKNGAGKSTLLKILSRITAPTVGRVELGGRVGSLLEVGTGFHPELSGRENVFLSGSILGMSHTEIVRTFDDIVDFSGISAFLDTPVKRYSSGMYVRLAFAVAAHLRSEILLVDEVLAVGDAEFQKRSSEKMGSVARDGRTVILTSHNADVLRRTCTSAALLADGHVTVQGDVETVLRTYTGAGGSDSLAAYQRAAPPPDAIAFESVRVTSPVLAPADPVEITWTLTGDRERVGEFFVGFEVTSESNQRVGHVDSRLLGVGPNELWRATASIRSPWLLPGRYSVHAFVFRWPEMFDRVEPACTFEVRDELPYPDSLPEGTVGLMRTASGAPSSILTDFSISSGSQLPIGSESKCAEPHTPDGS